MLNSSYLFYLSLYCDKINFDYEEIFIQNNQGIKLKAWLHEKDLINKKTILFFLIGTTMQGTNR